MNLPSGYSGHNSTARRFFALTPSRCLLRTDFGSSDALTLTPRKPKGMNSFQIFAAGWSSLVARKAHNLEVPGSNPGPATKTKGGLRDPFFYPSQSCSLGTEEPTSYWKFTANRPDETLRLGLRRGFLYHASKSAAWEQCLLRLQSMTVLR